MRRYININDTRVNSRTLHERFASKAVRPIFNFDFNKQFNFNGFRFASHQFTVRLGDVDLKRDDEPSGPVTYKVKEIRAHESFSRIGYYNDIAVLVLDRPVRKSRFIIPVCLPPNEIRNENFAGRRATVVGWGTTFYGKISIFKPFSQRLIVLTMLKGARKVRYKGKRYYPYGGTRIAIRRIFNRLRKTSFAPDTQQVVLTLVK